MVKIIDLTAISSKESHDLGQYLAGLRPDFLARKDKFLLSSVITSISHNLIKDKLNPNQFYVISNDPKDMLGSGGFGRVRRAMGVITLDAATKDAIYAPITNKVVKIFNHKIAQQKQMTGAQKDYRYENAVAIFKTSQHFAHLGMQEPVKRNAYKGKLFSFAEKSYSVMNNLPGRDLEKELIDFMKTRPSTHQMLTAVFLPLLLAYKAQVEKTGFAHLDINPRNIRAQLNQKSSVINFLDFDFSQKTTTTANSFGTPGFTAPEMCLSATNTISLQLDIFSLGITLICCLNSELHPHKYFDDVGDAQGLINIVACTQVRGFYNFSSLSWKSGKSSPGLFDNIDDSSLPDSLRISVRQKITDLLKDMTAYKPRLRPDINAVIARVMGIQREIDDGLAPKRRMGCC